jgi:GrpB-like predicted nucleotidyltransferase (UPF0157 family)
MRLSDQKWPPALGDSACGVEHVGSTAVSGLSAKPIIDIAVGSRPGGAVAELRARLEPHGFIHRGDMGSQGGVLFVLETAPWHRIAHVHVVPYGGESWVGYLAFRDLLRRDPAARDSYVRLKRTLAQRFPGDRAAYTAGKDQLVSALLSG